MDNIDDIKRQLESSFDNLKGFQNIVENQIKSFDVEKSENIDINGNNFLVSLNKDNSVSLRPTSNKKEELEALFGFFKGL